MAQQKKGTEIEQAEAYFAALKTVKSRFIQTNADGSQLRGTFYLNRPGKLRFEYDPPNKDFVVADGYFIYFYDGEMKQQTNAPIGQTLADFLLRKNLKLSGDLKVTRIMRAGGYIQITMIQRDLPKAGELTLAFTEGTKYQLKKWRIIDSVGNITETELFDMQTGLKIPSSLFAYKDPVAKGVNK
jgi:outer membrane lipoprotein-sorting protein